MGFDERGEGRFSVAPLAGYGDIAMKFDMDFTHGDAELIRAGRWDWPDPFRERHFVDEGHEVEGIELRDRGRCGGGHGHAGLCCCVIVRLRESGECRRGGGERAECRELLKNGTAGGGQTNSD